MMDQGASADVEPDLEPDLEPVACDLCGATDELRLFVAQDTNQGHAGRFPVVRCRHCGLVYISPRPRADHIAAYYPNDATYSCFAPPAVDRPRDDPIADDHPVVALLRDRGVRHGLIGDIGCGIGSFLKQMQTAGWEVWGIEPSAYARGKANERLGDGRVLASLEEADWAPASFDVLTLWHVLEHVPSPSRMLGAVEHLLKPGGVVGIAVPNFASLECRILRQHCIAIDAPRHFYHFEEATLRELVTRSGLHVESVRQYPSPISLAANTLRPLRLLAERVIPRHDVSRLSGAVAEEPAVRGDHLRSAVTATRKDRIRATLARILRPAAWAIARAGWGPELYLLASKAEQSS